MFCESFPREKEAKEQKADNLLGSLLLFFYPSGQLSPDQQKSDLHHLWLDRGSWTVRYLVSRQPLNRCLCLIYETGSVQLHGWSFFHAGWAQVCGCRHQTHQGRDRGGSVLRFIAKGGSWVYTQCYFNCCHYLITCSLLIRVKPNDEIFNFP